MTNQTTQPTYTRRALLTSTATAIGLGSLSGCTGILDTGPDAPDPDTPPAELLPYGDGWVPEQTSDLMAGMIGGNAGARGVYFRNNSQYSVEICRFSSEDLANERFPPVYESWHTALVRGVFGIAGNGPNGELVRSMLEASPAIEQVGGDGSLL